MPFPATRLRRLRRTAVLRDLVRETRLDAGDLIYPLFVEAGLDPANPRAAIASMPGVDRLSISEAVREAGEAASLGLPAVLLFGIPAHKDAEGSGAWDDEGVVQLATRAIKEAHPDLLVVATYVCASTPTRALRPAALGRLRRQRRLGRAAGSHQRVARSRGADVHRALGHDGRPRRGDPRRSRTRRALATSRSWPTAPSSPPPSTARSARQRTPRRPSATAAPTRWTRATATRPCARRCSTSRRGPIWSWSSRRCPTWTSCAASRTPPACRSSPITSAASTRCSRPPRPRATSTSARPCSRR